MLPVGTSAYSEALRVGCEMYSALQVPSPARTGGTSCRCCVRLTTGASRVSSSLRSQTILVHKFGFAVGRPHPRGGFCPPIGMPDRET